MEEPDLQHPYWNDLARRYSALTPPLRISDSERGIYQQLVEQWQDASRPPRVLVLGATPDFYHLQWPEETQILAVDRSQAMLSGVWPGTPAQTLCADWTAMQLCKESRDIVLCDGGLSFFSYPGELQKLLANVTRIMAPGGLFIVRLYVDGESHQTAEGIYQQFSSGHIRNSQELKLRLWLALQDRDGKGVRLHDVWSSFEEVCEKLRAQGEVPDWPKAEWESMRAYQGLQDIYYFPSAEQVTVLLQKVNNKVRLQASIMPSGPCHEHLKILSFRRNG
jgi:SAM-dependent methyltransferase